jgi:glycine cleavage system H protein
MYPTEFKYTRDHEWIAITDGEGRVGITDFAQKQLGDVVYVELPEVGRTLRQGEVFGTIESVKAVSELYSPMSGEVLEVNSTLSERPELVNRDPHGTWMIRLRLTHPEEAAALLDSEAYRALINE